MAGAGGGVQRIIDGLQRQVVALKNRLARERADRRAERAVVLERRRGDVKQRRALLVHELEKAARARREAPPHVMGGDCTGCARCRAEHVEDEVLDALAECDKS